MTPAPSCLDCAHHREPRHPIDDHWCACRALPCYQATKRGLCGPERRDFKPKETP